MNAALVNDEDKVIKVISVTGADEIAQLNQRAQDLDSGMTWREMTPYESGLLVGWVLPTIGGFKNE